MCSNDIQLTLKQAFQKVCPLTVISSKAVPCPPLPLPPSSILNAIPFVTKANLVFLVVLLSKRIEYPTKDDNVPTLPGGSPSSSETLCAREMAEIRRGSVQ